MSATEEQAQKLGVAPGQPLIGIESLASCGNGLALEYYNAVYNPTVARMHVVSSKRGLLSVSLLFNSGAVDRLRHIWSLPDEEIMVTKLVVR